MKTKLKASALVVTMMILGIILITALSISLVSIKERKASLGSNNSDQAFNTAQNGVESVLQQIKTNSSGMVAAVDSSCNGTISSGGYSVQLLDSSSKVIDSANGYDCSTTPVSSITKLKSVGTYGQDQRAIEVAVAQSATCKMVHGHSVTGNNICTNVTFPTGSFTQAPVVLATPNAGAPVAVSYNSITSTGFKLCGQSISSYTADWIAFDTATCF